MKKRIHIHKETVFVLFIMMALPLVYGLVFGTLWQEIKSGNIVGMAVIDTIRCSEYQAKESSLQNVIQGCSNCETERKELFSIQQFLDANCFSTPCSSGESRCRISSTGDTQWFQLCKDGIFYNSVVCYNGCNQDACVVDDFSITLRADPESVKFGRSSLITIELRNKMGKPMPGVPLTIGSTIRGVFLEKDLTTDNLGMAYTPYVAAELLTSEITVQATVGGVFKSAKTYVFVKNGP